MIRILEIAWLVITMLTVGIVVYQLFDEGPQAAIFWLIVSLIAFTMYMVRRRQRIRMEDKIREHQQEEAARYH